MIKNILTRVASGSVYVALIVLSLLLLDHSPITYWIVFSAIIVLGIKAINDMTDTGEPASWLIMLLDMLGGVAVFFAFYLEGDPAVKHHLWLLPPCVYIVLRLILQLYRPQLNALTSIQRSLFAVCYVAVPIGLLNVIASITAPRMLLALFTFIWINDTGAFLVGVALGRHRLFQRISPKKSWEGFFGGLLACIGTAFAIDKWFNDIYQVPDLTLWVGLSVVVSIAATFGDLVESLFKRTAGVKDSGKLMPGHGGILDRVDSLLMVAPAVLIYLILIFYNQG